MRTTAVYPQRYNILCLNYFLLQKVQKSYMLTINGSSVESVIPSDCVVVLLDPVRIFLTVFSPLRYGTFLSCLQSKLCLKTVLLFCLAAEIVNKEVDILD